MFCTKNLRSGRIHLISDNRDNQTDYSRSVGAVMTVLHHSATVSPFWDYILNETMGKYK